MGVWGCGSVGCDSMGCDSVRVWQCEGVGVRGSIYLY